MIMSKFKHGFEFYEQLTKESATVKTPEELVNEADDILRVIFNSLDNPEIISTKLLRLAVIYGGIGNCLAAAQNAERQAETTYKYELNKKKASYMKAGSSATAAEVPATVDVKKYRDDWDSWKHNASILKIKREDIEKVIDTGRSRLSFIKQEIKNEGI